MEDIIFDYGLFFVGYASYRMKNKLIFYFYGNWKHINGYIGEPQKTVKIFISNIKKKGIDVKMVSGVGEMETRSRDYKVLIFGKLPVVLLRTFVCILSGISFSRIHYIISKKKVTVSDIIFFLKNVDFFTKVRYIPLVALVDLFLPQQLYQFLIKAYERKIYRICFPTQFVDQSKISLCWRLEKSYLKQVVFLAKRNFSKKKVKLIYFGRDSYLRGVDLIEQLNGVHKDYNFYCTGFFPFKGDQRKSEFNSPYHIFLNDKSILKKVNKATISIFPFRTKIGGPDVPAALIESFLLGVPPIISKVLLFDVLEQHNYPLVIDSISAESVKKCIEENIKNRDDYKKIINICYLISRDIIRKYGYDFSLSSLSSKINV